MSAALAGDGDAWAVLVRHHQDPVFRLAYLILGDADEAEDVAQDVFIRAHHHCTSSIWRVHCVPGCWAFLIWRVIGFLGFGGDTWLHCASSGKHSHRAYDPAAKR